MAQNTLKIDDGVKAVRAGQYAGQNITDIIFPESLEEIGERAFADCPDLKRLWIPRTVKSIGREAFWGCGSLRRVFIPDSVESIGHAAFDYRSCEIFCEAPSCPYGWYRDYYETFDYDDNEEQCILSMYESWCGYDVEMSYPEWYSESIPGRKEPRNLCWNAAEERVRAIWEQEEWVLERDTAKRMAHSIQYTRDLERRIEEGALDKIGRRIEEAKQNWRKACEPYRAMQGFYPEEILPAAISYIESLKALEFHYACRHDLNKDYEATWEIFRVYCELVPGFENASFRKELDSVRDALKRLVYYGAGAGGSSEERARIDRAYEESMEAKARMER